MDEFPPDPDELLALARRAQAEPDAEVRLRVRRGVAGALVAGAAVSTTAMAARAGSKSGWSAALLTKLAAGAAVCAVALGVFLSMRSPPRVEPHAESPVVQERVPVERASDPAPSEASADVLLAAPPKQVASERERSPTRHDETSRARSAPLETTPSLRAELALLDQAERALDRDEPARALALLNRHRTRFASSGFALERDGLSLIARCMSGRGDDDEVTRFLSESGGALLHDRVRSTCLEPR